MAIRNTRAKIRLSTSQIHQMLELPDTLEVLYIGGDFDPPSVTVVVHGDHLPVTPEYEVLPFLQGSLMQERVVVDGKVYSRWAWSQVDMRQMSLAAGER